MRVMDEAEGEKTRKIAHGCLVFEGTKIRDLQPHRTDGCILNHFATYVFLFMDSLSTHQQKHCHLTNQIAWSFS